VKRRTAYWLIILACALGAAWCLMILWPMVTQGGHP